MTYFNVGLKLLLGFIGLLIVMRMLGRKELSEVTPFDVVYGVVFGGIVEESLYDNKINITHMLFGIFFWGLIIYTVEIITRHFDWPRKVLKGRPSFLVEDGQLNYENMKKNKLEMEQLRSLMRMQGVFTMKEVKYLILEPGGQISIQKYEQYDEVTKEEMKIKASGPSRNYLLINQGEINKADLKALGKDEAWLKQLIQQKDGHQIKDILYAEWSELDGLFVRLFHPSLK